MRSRLDSETEGKILYVSKSHHKDVDIFENELGQCSHWPIGLCVLLDKRRFKH